jgi:hypothetical protein
VFRIATKKKTLFLRLFPVNGPATPRTLYKKLLALYPRGFRERLGESMQQTFNDLYKERQTEGGLFGFVLWTFVETAMGIVREHVLLITKGATMKTMLANPRSAAVISSILCLPASIILLFDMIGVSQDFWPLPVSPEIVVPVAFLLLPVALIVSRAPIRVPAIIGFFFVLPFLILEFVTRSNLPRSNASIVLFVFMWLLSTAFIAILMLIVRNVRAGNNIVANPVFLSVSVVFLVSIAWEWGALVIDQMPCFLGATGC